MRITAQLIRTSDNTHIFSKHYDVEETDIFEIQDNIASSIVQMLNITLSTNEQDRLVKKQTTEEAYTIYLKGLFQYKKENVNDAKPLFEDVIARDSLYAPAHAYLALSKAWIAIRGRSGGTPGKDDEATLDAIKSAQTAIRLDPMLPEGYSCLALIAWAIEHDFGKARDYFDKSLKLDPGSSLIKNRYCYFLTWMGDFDRARALAKEAMSIDPVDYNSYIILYAISFYSEDFAAARLYTKELNNLAGRSDNIPSIELTFYDGNFNKVNKLCDSLSSAGKELSELDLSYSAMAYFATHDVKKSNDQIRLLVDREHRTQTNARYYAARVYAFRHQSDSVFSNLSKSARKREINFIRLKIDHAFKELRNDPRYIELYNSLGFDKY
jgi:Tfp pilus assembly protein PilF